MRGASALNDALPTDATRPIRVLLIWEPVIFTDRGPPSARVRARAGDARIEHFWDPGLLVSEAAIRTAMAHRDQLDLGEIDEDTVAWDIVAIFPPGIRWDDAFPLPSWHDAPVVHGAAELKRRLAEAPPKGERAP